MSGADLPNGAQACIVGVRSPKDAVQPLLLGAFR